ncbi:dyp-type peroxidase [Bondarzewia mesenterica]|uniref:Dyp-type peroxidase n=1 Tax=Bondarzewia mesenterica TaxID=1095465 RepID=A0A4S4LYP6_9AGAM|nr:dyp-type peroxidase [Bondarzewia mesenterica]
MTTHTPAPLDLANVQGDILSGLPKKTQTYVFFQITNSNAFRTALAHLVPLITSTKEVVGHRQSIADNKAAAARNSHEPPLLEIVGVNVAFSQIGLNTMGIKDDIQAEPNPFKAGQLKDAQNLGDKGVTDKSGNFVPDWIDAFKHPVHGVFIISGHDHPSVSKKVHEVEHIFGVDGQHPSFKEVLKVVGDVRPGKEKGHEHFGFLDGISQPAVKDFDKHPNPGQETVRQGIILVGRDGDGDAKSRPTWALDGSFVGLRYLFQLVPEFNKFLLDNPIDLPGLTREKGSELLGARLMGRWKSGAPIDITPLQDNLKLGPNAKENNNFRYQGEIDSQTRCPFSAHTRKTNPRADLEDLPPSKGGPVSNETRRIIRRGIQFGPELTEEENCDHKTKHGRGLLFVSYQSNISNGFQFLQHSWANNTQFPPRDKSTVIPGFDPIIGQADGAARHVTGSNPQAAGNQLTLPIDFVVPKGGEYFFSPSIPALRDTFALGAHIESHH